MFSYKYSHIVHVEMVVTLELLRFPCQKWSLLWSGEWGKQVCLQKALPLSYNSLAAILDKKHSTKVKGILDVDSSDIFKELVVVKLLNIVEL